MTAAVGPRVCFFFFFYVNCISELNKTKSKLQKWFPESLLSEQPKKGPFHGRSRGAAGQQLKYASSDYTEMAVTGDCVCVA